MNTSAMPKQTTRPHWVQSLLCSTLLTGCSTAELLTVESPAISAAKEEVKRRSGLTHVRVEGAERIGNGWRVIVCGQPTRPGSHFFVEVTDDGRVVAFRPGLYIGAHK